MLDAPYTTGQEILSYKGDANLATGSGQAAYNTNPNDQHPLSDLNTTLGKLADYDAHMQVLKYQQKIQDNKDLAAMLADTGGSAFNMAGSNGSGGSNGRNLSFAPLPEDKKILDDKADQLRKMVIGNPSGWKYDSAVLKAKQELESLKNHASQRAVFYTQNNAEAAQNNDPAERQAIQQNTAQEVNGYNLTDYHTPTPHLNALTHNFDHFYPADMFKNKELENDFQVSGGTDENGNVVYKTKYGLSNTAADIRAKINPGSTLYPEAVNWTKSYLNSPLAYDVNDVTKRNKNIDVINQERGLQPGDAHYIPHIAEVVQGANGPQVKITNTNPADVVYSLAMEGAGALNEASQIKKNAQDVNKEQVDIANIRNEIKNRDAAAAEKIREFDNPQDKGKAAKGQTAQQAADMRASQSVANRVKSVFNPANYPKQNAIEAGLRAMKNQSIQKALDDNGYGSSEWKIIGEPTVADVRDLSGVEERSGEAGKEKPTGETAKSDKAVVIKNKAGDTKLVFVKKDNESKEKKYDVQSVVDGKTAVSNATLHKHRYKVTKEASEEMNRNQSAYDGGEAAGPAQDRNVPAAPPVRKTIGGATYEKDSNGKWFKI